MLSKKEIGEKIKRLRKEQEKSQEDLGKYLGRTHAAISYVENGTTELSYEDLRKVALFFNMTISELVEEEQQRGFQQNFRTGRNFSKEELKKALKALDEIKKILD